jgi:hypothetical protein
MRFDPIPQARVVRHAGELVAPPPQPRPPRPPRSAEPEASWLGTAAVYAVGLWPLTCVLLLVAGLLVLTANLGAP